MKILKFGGSSVATPERIRAVIDIVKQAQKEEPVAVVVSAFQGVTDQLIALVTLAGQGAARYHDVLIELTTRHLVSVNALVASDRQSSVSTTVKKMFSELADIAHGAFLLREVSPRTMDLVMSFGEQLSALIVAEAFREQGLEAQLLDTRQLVRTDADFGNARVDFETTYKLISDHFATSRPLQIITGFIASTATGETTTLGLRETTTLGRGGSDYTASIFGAALTASEVQIWTDVDGVMTADPRKVKDAFVIPRMTYQEALEMSHFGAKVIHPPTIRPVMERGIPLRIKNTLNPAAAGTLITSETSHNGMMARGIVSIADVTLGRVQCDGVGGIVARLFGVLAEQKVRLVVMTQESSEQSVCFAVSSADALRTKRAIEEELALETRLGVIGKIIFEPHQAIVTVVGERVRDTPGVAARIFGALSTAGVDVTETAQGASGITLSIIVGRAQEKKTLNTIHSAFFAIQNNRAINVFLVGTGLVGGTLLKQIQARAAQGNSLTVRVMGVTNSKTMMLEEGIEQPTDVRAFVGQIKARQLPHSVLVDCTASDVVVPYYEELLRAGISIVTPNKRANSGSMGLYRRIREASQAGRAKFLYETNVGAALPIISTLHDLIVSGDRVLKIEAVLSGTLSYIFNSFTHDRSFSAVVREAKEKGYTEPDPRDDLSGMDVVRKLLILAREMGLALELQDIEVENLVPASARTAGSVEEFFVRMKESDAEFAVRRDRATHTGKKLCYLGTIENGRAHVALQEVGPEHPFHELSGSDNMIVFITEHYCERPLVIRGPGAGAEVTAGGVLMDIVRVYD